MERGRFFEATGGEEQKEKGQAAEDASRYCPQCSARLEAHKCKLICKRCGDYMSRSDCY